MNGIYQIANAMAQHSTEYEAEFFDVYSHPIHSYYSQVYWKAMDPVSLPNYIVERFRNKTIAIVGYEVDQVKRTPHGEDIPVPITHAYNHHYMAWLSSSKHAKLTKKKATEDMIRLGVTHGMDEYWDVEGSDSSAGSDTEVPTQTCFSEGNGGEFRLSYHGYPKGYAQLLQSPNTFLLTPMQIDTWNREEIGHKFRAGPLPRNSFLYNETTATYSGLLECPCSDRIEKKWSTKYKLQSPEKICDSKGSVENATECWFSAQQVVPAPHIVKRSLHGDLNNPVGCSSTLHENGTLDIVWNNPRNLSMGAFRETQVQRESEEHAVVAFASGSINLTVALKVDQRDPSQDTATITLTGPIDAWFGTGFGTTDMCRHMQADLCPDGGPYAIVVFGGEVQERQLNFHGPGVALPPTVRVVSNEVVGGNRTVTVTRPLNGPDERYYNFDIEETALPIITARGCGLTFAQHCGHGSSELTFMAANAPLRICRAGIQGTVGGKNFRDDRCAPVPESDLLKQNNPTCFIQTYQGGLNCCKHLQPLLDKDQSIPWAEHTLKYHLKFRFYFEEYRPASASQAPSHQILARFYRQTEFSAGEFDVTPCPLGTPPSQCIQEITSRWSVREMLVDCSLNNLWCTGANSTAADGIELIYAGPHCHAPSCLSMELYNADTGELLCGVAPVVGQGTDELYDELGFLAIPPCLWGAPVDGLGSPRFLSSNTTLLSIKRNNNTMPHTGEMASWQMRGIVVMNEDGRVSDKGGIFNDVIGNGQSGQTISHREVEARTSRARKGNR